MIFLIIWSVLLVLGFCGFLAYLAHTLGDF
jgi:hypothetical protein